MSLGGMFGGSGNAYKKSTDAIARARDQARNDVSEGSDNIKKYIEDKARQEIIDAQSNARDALTQGVDQATPYLQEVVDLYSSLSPEDLAARDMYLNSIGLHGDTWNQTALDTFQASPGYQYSVDQAEQAILRNNAATGGVLSGNTGLALNKNATDLANQEWGNWQDRLMNQGNYIYQDYSGQSQGLTNLANLFSSEGAGLADIAMNGGNKRADLYSTAGQLLNSNNLTNANLDWNRGVSNSNAYQAQAAADAAQQQAVISGLMGMGSNLFSFA